MTSIWKVFNYDAPLKTSRFPLWYAAEIFPRFAYSSGLWTEMFFTMRTSKPMSDYKLKQEPGEDDGNIAEARWISQDARDAAFIIIRCDDVFFFFFAELLPRNSYTWFNSLLHPLPCDGDATEPEFQLKQLQVDAARIQYCDSRAGGR